jgi:hypothetical protein
MVEGSQPNLHTGSDRYVLLRTVPIYSQSRATELGILGDVLYSYQIAISAITSIITVRSNGRSMYTNS